MIYKTFRLLPRYRAQIVNGKVYGAQDYLGDRLVKQFKEWEQQGLQIVSTIQARDETGDFLIVILRHRD